MVIALVLLGVALAISLYFNFFGSAARQTGPEVQTQLEAEVKARKELEAAIEKKNRDSEAVKVQLNELKDELKQAKKKLHDQRESEKGNRDLAKAREEVERNASVQLENVRAELNAALVELERLRAEKGPGGRRAPAPAPAPVPVTAAAVTPEPAAPAPAKEPVQRVIRELSEADKEKMARLETEAQKARARAAELEKDVRRLKGRVETQSRVYTVTRSELDLVKDKFRALEKRLNRTLLERDLVRRAISDLEKKTGSLAERTELTAEEMAASDKTTDARHAEELAHEKAREVERAAAEKATEEAAPATDAAAAPAVVPPTTQPS